MGFHFVTKPVGSEVCQLYDTLKVEEGANVSDATCYARKAFTNHNTVSTGTTALWKIYWDLRVGDYKTKYDEYISVHNGNWAAFEVKGKPERKRLADVALWTKEQTKAKAVLDAYKSGTLDGVESTKNTEQGKKTTAYGKITDLAYYQAVDAQTSAKAEYDKAAAAVQANSDKITRIAAILLHMKNGDKGTIADLTKQKQTKDAEIGGADGWEKKIEGYKKELEGLTGTVTSTKKAMDEAKATWDGKKAAAEKALAAVTKPLEEVGALRGKVTTENLALTKAVAAVAEQDGKIKAQEAVVEKERLALAAATAKCKGTKYDQFRTDVAQKEADRASTLQAIEKLIDARTVIAHGATGGRCEKPQSNGDHLRRGKCAADTDCCGAATGRPNGASGPLVTIEVCLEKSAKQYAYVAPRPALAKEDPKAVNWPFVCIGGATQLAGAAAAALASAYMMA